MRAESPDLAGSLDRMAPDPGWSRRRYDLVVVVCAISGLLCLAVAAPGAGLAALSLGVIVFRIRWWRFPERRTTRPERWRRSRF